MRARFAPLAMARRTANSAGRARLMFPAARRKLSNFWPRFSPAWAFDLGSAFGSALANPVSPNDGILSNTDTAAGNTAGASGNNGIDYPVFTALTRTANGSVASGTIVCRARIIPISRA